MSKTTKLGSGAKEISVGKVAVSVLRSALASMVLTSLSSAWNYVHDVRFFLVLHL